MCVCVCACVRACLCVCACACVCASLASDSSETVNAIIIKFGTAADSDMRMHHVLMILTLTTFIQGYLDINHDNNKYSVISENVQAMPIKFAVKIVRLKV